MSAVGYGYLEGGDDGATWRAVAAQPRWQAPLAPAGAALSRAPSPQPGGRGVAAVDLAPSSTRAAHLPSNISRMIRPNDQMSAPYE